jgi:hypothetical protein
MTKHPFTGGVIIPTACWLCGEELAAPVHVEYEQCPNEIPWDDASDHLFEPKEDRSIKAMYPIDREKALRGFVDG